VDYAKCGRSSTAFFVSIFNSTPQFANNTLRCKMEAEERPTKLRKLEYSAVVDDSVTADDDLANGVAPTKMSVDAHRDEAKGFKPAPADAIETNEADSAESEISGSEENEEHRKPDEPFNSTRPLSKNALKRMRNKERWDAGRDARKLKRKQKIAEKRIRKRAVREETRAVAAAKAGEEAHWKGKKASILPYTGGPEGRSRWMLTVP
jgi:tRNA (guanine9-N1)-methyltransferase